MKNLIQKLQIKLQIKFSALFWLVVALASVPVVNDLAGLHLGTMTLEHFAWSLPLDIFGVGVFIWLLRIRGRVGYGFISLLAFIAILGRIIYFALLISPLKFWGWQEIWSMYTYRISSSFIELCLAIPVFIMSSYYFRYGIRQEKRIARMTDKELLRGYLEDSFASRKYAENPKKKYQKRAKDLERNAIWNRFELKKRNPDLDKLFDRFNQGDDQAKGMVYAELEKKYGAEPLKSMFRTWQPPALE
jgi:hypothetical protein